MKKFQNKNGNFLVSENIEIDTDDLLEKEEKINKTNTEKNDFISKSECLVHIYYDEKNKFSGTLENYKFSRKLVDTLHSGRQIYSYREIIMLVGYDSLKSYLNNCNKYNIKKINIEHIAGHEQQLVAATEKFNYNQFEIMEINGPLFKIRIELVSET